jgi:hypothetical protein
VLRNVTNSPKRREWQQNTLLSTFVLMNGYKYKAAIIEIVCQYFFMDYELALAGALCKV